MLTASELCTKAGARLVLYTVRLLDMGLGADSPSCPPSCVLAAGVLHWLCISVGQVNYPKVADSSSFDEDSSDALSPEQPASHESQGSVPSPLEPRASDPLSSATSISPTQVRLPLSFFLTPAKAAQSLASVLGRMGSSCYVHEVCVCVTLISEANNGPSSSSPSVRRSWVGVLPPWPHTLTGSPSWLLKQVHSVQRCGCHTPSALRP